jgi:hypothetical protein
MYKIFLDASLICFFAPIDTILIYFTMEGMQEILCIVESRNKLFLDKEGATCVEAKGSQYGED